MAVISNCLIHPCPYASGALSGHQGVTARSEILHNGKVRAHCLPVNIGMPPIGKILQMCVQYQGSDSNEDDPNDRACVYTEDEIEEHYQFHSSGLAVDDDCG
jgi:hypothetical protein